MLGLVVMGSCAGIVGLLACRWVMGMGQCRIRVVYHRPRGLSDGSGWLGVVVYMIDGMGDYLGFHGVLWCYHYPCSVSWGAGDCVFLWIVPCLPSGWCCV